jgi:NitT/TauT family transport system substrate-binding protein
MWAVLVVGALLGLGCGSGAAPSGRASDGAPAGSAAPAPATGGSGAAPQALIPVKASFSAFAMSQSPIEIAKEGGYFAEEGLDVEILSIRSSAQNAAALLSGEVDVSTIGGVGLVRARLQGSDLLFIGGTKPYFAGAIVARPDITTVADLRGKRIGITAPGGNTDLMARALLPRLGLDPGRDVVLFATGGDPESVAALVSGGIESASLTPPADDRARNAGFPTLVDVTAERLPYPAAALGTAGPTLASRADGLERYLRGYAKGVRRYMADKPFALQVAASFLKSDDQAANNDAYELEKGLMEGDLDLPLAAVQGTLDLIKGDEPRAADARPEDFVDLRLQRKLKESGFFDRLTTEIPTR